MFWYGCCWAASHPRQRTVRFAKRPSGCPTPVVKAEPGLNGAEPMATDEPKKDDDKMDEG